MKMKKPRNTPGLLSKKGRRLYPAEQPDTQQNDDRTNGSCDDVIDDTGADGNTQRTQKPSTDKCADDTDDHSSKTSQADAAHQPIGDRARHPTNNDPDYD